MGFNHASNYPAGVEIIINLINPMARDWTILSNRPISLIR